MGTQYPLPLSLVALLCVLGAGCSHETERYAGNELFAANCSACHGIYGDGAGPAAATVEQSIPDLRLIAARNGGEFPRALVARIVDGRAILDAHASDTMPRWGAEFELDEGNSEAALERVRARIDAIVDYVEGIQIAE